MKTRDIRSILKSRGMERGTLVVLETLNEEIQQQSRDMKEQASLFTQMCESFSHIVDVSDHLKNFLEATTPREIDGEQHGVSVHSLGDGDQ